MQTRARARQLSSSFVQITGDDVDFFHISFFCKFSFTFRFSWALALILLLSIRWVGCCVLACDEFGFAICQTHYLSCFRLPALLHRLKKYLNFKSEEAQAKMVLMRDKEDKDKEYKDKEEEETYCSNSATCFPAPGTAQAALLPA